VFDRNAAHCTCSYYSFGEGGDTFAPRLEGIAGRAVEAGLTCADLWHALANVPASRTCSNPPNLWDVIERALFP
jgi:hypothetical protein